MDVAIHCFVKSRDDIPTLGPAERCCPRKSSPGYHHLTFVTWTPRVLHVLFMQFTTELLAQSEKAYRCGWITLSTPGTEPQRHFLLTSIHIL
jgi:hypothetical protein